MQPNCQVVKNKPGRKKNIIKFLDVVHNRVLFNCNTCTDRQCENKGGEEWHTPFWDLSPEADWNGKICPKPSAMLDTLTAHWFELYLAFRDRGLPPDSGGYNDQSAKIMGAFSIISRWQQQHDEQQREKQQRELRHNQFAGIK